MTILRGASGDVVAGIQARLRSLNLYRGPVDGSFGGGTESAVKSFQQNRGLKPDGCVGPLTWSYLFPDEPPPRSDMPSKPVSFRCLALTGSFETSTNPPECFSGLSGDFDGQGISFGALQWNIGQGTLQPLLKRMIQTHRDLCSTIFHESVPVLEALLDAPRREQLTFARSLQDPRSNVLEPWRGMLKSLGRTPEFQHIQAEHAAALYQRARSLAQTFDVNSERGVALMFDILVQNGSISDIVKAQIFSDYRTAPAATGPERELARLRIIAQRRSAAVKAQFIADVRTRKMAIAEGSGVVHGLPYDLEEQFGLRLTPASA